LILTVVGIAAAIVIAGAVTFGIVVGSTTKLSHSAVEHYIATTYNVAVVCNNGKDMTVRTGRSYPCAGSGVVVSVRLLDGKGTYEVDTGGVSSSQP
jgi:hypothetical protein